MLRDTQRVVALSGYSTAAGGAPPALSAPDGCRLYYEQDTDQLLVSLNGGPYVAIAGPGGAGGWTDDGTVVRLTTASDRVAVGQATPVNNAKFTLTGPQTDPQLRLQDVGQFSWIQLAPTEATQPTCGWLVQGGSFFGVWNQTFFVGHNPTAAGIDAGKKQLGLAGELDFKATALANPKAEIYFVWQNAAGTRQIRPVGSTIDNILELSLNALLGDTYFLDEAAAPTQLAHITRTGAIFSDGGSSAGFFAAGNNRLILAADNTVGINQQLIQTVNNTELRIPHASSWTRLTVPCELDMSAAHRQSGDIAPAALAADVNDYNPTGLSTASVIRQASSGAVNRNVTGLAGGSDGRVISFFNISDVAAETITLTHEDAASAAANRFHLPNLANYLISRASCVQLWYDPALSRWRVMS